MDVTQETQMEVDEIHVEYPFPRTRLGNEYNPFVGGDDLPVPDHSKKVSVPDDSDDEQEFNERFV